MDRKYKILTISFFLSLPFWWMVNIMSAGMDDFWFLRQIPNSSGASLNETLTALQKIKNERALINKLNGLDINSKSAYVIEIDNDWNVTVLFEKDSKRPLPIASLTKLMTALVVFDLDETYKGKIGRDELINKMLIESDNQAAFNLAGFIGNDPFADLMNIYSKNIGLSASTFFINPTGLDDDKPTNISTAEDISKLTLHILKNYPEIFQITSNRNFIDKNTNKLLAEYPEIIGGKTGWTTLANGCLLVIAEKPDNQGYFLNIILGADDRFSEMRKILNAELIP